MEKLKKRIEEIGRKGKQKIYLEEDEIFIKLWTSLNKLQC